MASVKLYTSKSGLSPFVQRAWIALLEKGIDFEMVVIDPSVKSKDWLTVNPRGLIPALVHNGKSVYESPIILEYIQDAWPEPAPLLPQDPYGRAWSRIWADHINKRITPPFYQLLLKQDVTEQENARVALLKGLEDLALAMDADGPLFNSGGSLSLVDIMLIPFAQRLCVLKHYRNFTLPETGQPWVRLEKWMNAALNRESAVKTLEVDTETMLKLYTSYADGSAKSGLADAILQGKPLP